MRGVAAGEGGGAVVAASVVLARSPHSRSNADYGYERSSKSRHRGGRRSRGRGRGKIEIPSNVVEANTMLKQFGQNIMTAVANVRLSPEEQRLVYDMSQSLIEDALIAKSVQNALPAAQAFNRNLWNLIKQQATDRPELYKRYCACLKQLDEEELGIIKACLPGDSVLSELSHIRGKDLQARSVSDFQLDSSGVLTQIREQMETVMDQKDGSTKINTYLQPIAASKMSANMIMQAVDALTGDKKYQDVKDISDGVQIAHSLKNNIQGGAAFGGAFGSSSPFGSAPFGGFGGSPFGGAPVGIFGGSQASSSSPFGGNAMFGGVQDTTQVAKLTCAIAQAQGGLKDNFRLLVNFANTKRQEQNARNLTATLKLGKALLDVIRRDIMPAGKTVAAAVNKTLSTSPNAHKISRLVESL